MLTPQDIREIKDWTQLLGLFAVLLGLWKGVYELWVGRKQREKELVWKQINTAKELLNDIHTHDLAKNAVHMLDWCDGQAVYQISTETRLSIAYKEVLEALQMNGMPPQSDSDVYVRDCFDWFFYRVDRIEHYINRGLIDFQDVKSVFQPYAREIEKHKPIFEEFLAFHEYRLAEQFFDRYKCHGSESTRTPSDAPSATRAAAGA